MCLDQQLTSAKAWSKGEARDCLPDEVDVLNLPEDAVVFQQTSLPAACAAAAPTPHNDNACAVPAVEAAILWVVDDRVYVALVHSLCRDQSCARDGDKDVRATNEGTERASILVLWRCFQTC